MISFGEGSIFEGGMGKKKEEKVNCLAGKMELKMGCKYSCISIFFGF